MPTTCVYEEQDSQTQDATGIQVGRTALCFRENVLRLVGKKCGREPTTYTAARPMGTVRPPIGPHQQQRRRKSLAA